MPRVKVTDAEQKRRNTIAVITGAYRREGHKWLDLYKICGFSVNTARNREKKPENFTLKELRRMTFLTDEERLKIWHGKP